MEKTIEIPFGAKDSELKGWEYTIPENMEAEIKDGKIIVREKEGDDERIRKDLITFICQFAPEHLKVQYVAYLERQKEQKPAEWSEEDENIYNKALDAIYYKDCNEKDDVISALNDLCDLISRKRKVIPPYANWKPSEEQMKWLKDVIETVPMTCRQQVPLESLYNDLQKLL